MRILALRGENIASLDRFEIEFRAEPLASAGIFAIVGPTGSGKSSILDAMCLSLYHQAPRMEGVSSQEAKLGGSFGEIGQNDIRNLIRRGTSTGWAETDFVGIDGAAYRARWGWRAGKKKGSASQEEVSLVRLPEGSVVANSKSACLERTRELVGLSFEQFTRTVLLAQGRFAEFLRANERQRADLLERLTGTEIYSRISRAVHDRKVEEAKVRQDLESRLEGVQIMETGARLSGETELSHLEAELPRWRERLDRSRNFSDLVDAWIRERARRSLLLARLEDLDLRRIGFEERRHAARSVLEETGNWWTAREQEIRNAELLDVRLDGARIGESEKEGIFQAVSAEVAVLERECVEIARRLEVLSARLTEIDTFLETNRRLGPVAADWQQCRTLLEICATALREKGAQELAAASACSEISRLVPLVEGSELRVGEIEASLEGTDPEGIPAELDGIDSGLRDLEILRTWMDLDAQEEEARRSLGRAGADRDRDSASMAVLEESVKLARRLLDSTRDAASRSAEDLRRNLVEGEPCPVCGSLHHPRGPSDSGPLQALLAEHLAVVSEREGKLDELKTSLARAEASLDQARRELRRLWDRRESMGPLPQFVTDPPPEEASERARWIELRREALSGRKNALQAMQRDLGRLGGARLQLSESRSGLASARERERSAAEAVRKAVEELGSRSAELDAKFGGDAWRARWEADPKGYVEQIQQRVVEFQRRTDLRSTTTREMERETVLRTENGRNLASKARERDAAREAVDSSREGRRRLESERGAFLDGVGVPSARAAASARLREAETSLEARRSELDGCLREMEGHKGALGQLDVAIEGIREAISKDGPALSVGAELPWRGAEADDATLRGLSDRILGWNRTRADEAGKTAMRLRAELELDDKNRRNAQGLVEGIRNQSEIVERWSALSASIGSADGKAFRAIAQRFTLEALLEEANRELSRIAPRYGLRIIEDSMHFGVVDRDAFGEIRPVHTLSGGESFMVSLALALGLSHLAGGDLRIESLFIDEGFGALDPSTLRSVMGALSSLHAQGRKVGVVTHVDEMKEQIDVRIEVVRVGPGRSTVRVVG